MSHKIPVRIHPVFWLFAGLIGLLRSQEPIQIFVWIIVILISILVHEYGHALTAQAFSQRASISLFAFGGMTYREGPKLSLGKEFLVVFAGPFFGFGLCLASYWLLHLVNNHASLLFFTLNLFMYVNLLWTVLNLIPVLPLDGGYLFSIVMEKLFGFKGMRAAHFCSFVLAFLLTIAFFVMGQLFLGVLFSMLGFMSYRSYKQVQMMSQQDQNANLKALLEESEKLLMAGDKQAAMEGFRKIRQENKGGVIYSIATETLALLLLEAHEHKEAYEMLLKLPKVSAEVLPKFHLLAYEAKDFEKTISIGKEAFQLQPTADTAILNALASAALHQVEPAVGWLECALGEGIADIDTLLKKPEFDSIRADPSFQNFVRGV